jgi:hypothetical protein
MSNSTRQVGRHQRYLRSTERESWRDAVKRIPDASVRQKVERLIVGMGRNIPRPAKTELGFTLVAHKAYFRWDQKGSISQGMFPWTAKPKHPYRIVVIEDDQDSERLSTDAGFHQEPSLDGNRTYRVFELRSSTTDKDLDRLVAVIRGL